MKLEGLSKSGGRSLRGFFTAINPLNAFYIFLNIAASISIVFANKFVFQLYNFRFGTFLTLIHFLVTFLCLLGCVKAKIFEAKYVPMKEAIPLSVAFCSFVVLTNLSLDFNSVGFYQIAKVLTTPTIVLIQYYWYKQSTERKIILSLVPVTIGVALASATDVQANFWGTVFAGLGILAASLYQIWVGTKQKSLGVDATQLLLYQAPISGIILFVTLPLTENLAGLKQYWQEEMTMNAFLAISFSAFLAFLVNLSTFLVIGKTSPITYNIAGHFKLCMILLGGFIMFNYPLDKMNLTGIGLALIGIFTYTHIKLQKSVVTKP